MGIIAIFISFPMASYFFLIIFNVLKFRFE